MASSKTQEQRIEDGAMGYAKSVYQFDPKTAADFAKTDHAIAVAQMVLEAADAPLKPVWPTDESVALALRLSNPNPYLSPESIRDGLRAALLADPIIKAAIACRYATSDEMVDAASRSLDQAVDEAGL